jgi:aminoglycoside 6'-N-acetyltransferase
VTLRQVHLGDEPALARIFSDPTVAEWWGDPEKAVREAMAVSEVETHYLIEVGDETVGMIQSYEETDDMYSYASIDVAVRTAWQGRGIGPEAIRTLARHLIDDRGYHRLTIDPAAHNARAIRAYERVGFKPVGVMRQYEKGPDGTWHDGLLMDMLAEELRD